MNKIFKINLTTLLLVLDLAIPFSSYGMDGQIKLTQPVAPDTFPIVINKSGSYVLTSNLVVTTDVNAIEITVDDVTIDLNGHMIRGPYTSHNPEGNGSGIYALNKFTITIKNGRIWGFAHHGIDLRSESSHPSYNGAGYLVEKIQAVNNGLRGIDIRGGVLTNCVANGNGDTGIEAKNCTITDCTANTNQAYGISAFGVSINSCTVNYNHSMGILANESSINNCTSRYNSWEGYSVTDSSITNSTANYNSHDGIDASGSLITNCVISYNGDDGIDAGWSNHIVGNILRSNGQASTGTSGYGIYSASSGNYIIKNTAINTHGPGNFRDDGINNYMPLTGDNANHGW